MTLQAAQAFKTIIGGVARTSVLHNRVTCAAGGLLGPLAAEPPSTIRDMGVLHTREDHQIGYGLGCTLAKCGKLPSTLYLSPMRGGSKLITLWWLFEDSKHAPSAY